MRRRGNMILEAALWIPILTLLLVGMVQFGKITYTYYSLKKTLYSAARLLSVQQGVNFCDEADASIAAAKNFAVTGTTDGSADPHIAGFSADMIQIQMECYDADSGGLGDCNTSACDSVAGPPRPDFIVVSIPDGYPMQPRIPFLLLDPIPLRPSVRVPYGGA